MAIRVQYVYIILTRLHDFAFISKHSHTKSSHVICPTSGRVNNDGGKKSPLGTLYTMDH